MSETEDEASLLAAAAKGDQASFARIYLAHRDSLLAVAAHVLSDREAAEDVVHDVFVSLARQAGRLRLKRALKDYLLASCVNRSRDVLRRRRREQATAPTADPPSPAPTPRERAEIAEDVARVVEALASLPPEQREVVALHTDGQLKFRQVAALLGISINTAQSRYRYALNALRAALDERRELP